MAIASSTTANARVCRRVPVYSFIESRPGVYWVGTHGGLARFDATRAAGRRAALHRPRQGVAPTRRPVMAFLRDRSGTLWAAGEEGSFGLTTAATMGSVRIEPVSFAGDRLGRVGRIRALLEDHEGSLWMAGDNAIVRRTADQRAVVYAMQVAGRLLKARCLLEVEPGTLWIGTSNTVIVLRAEPQRAARGLDASAFEKARPVSAGYERAAPCGLRVRHGHRPCRLAGEEPVPIRGRHHLDWSGERHHHVRRDAVPHLRQSQRSDQRNDQRDHDRSGRQRLARNGSGWRDPDCSERDDNVHDTPTGWRQPT